MNVTEKSYDHRNKVGNQGDLIKHFALHLVASTVRSGSDTPFIYVETHAGRPSYQLDPANLSNGWKQGVGDFLNRYYEMKEAGRNQDLLNDVGNFAAYVERGKSDEQINYLGSSALVRNVLRQRPMPVQSVLYDLDPDVCHALNSDDDSITVHCSSGYESVEGLSDIDLLFIDPPDLYPGDEGHAGRHKKLLYYCADKGIQFVSWNPLYSNKRLSGPSLECRVVKECARQKRYSIITVRWSDWSEKMCGCQMLFNLPKGSSYVDSCLKLATLMGWKTE